MVISADTLAAVAENAADDLAGETIDDALNDAATHHPWALPDSQPAARRRTPSGRYLRVQEQVQRMQAHRDRLAGLIKSVRDPEHHGALRHAVLRLDAEILTMQRASDRLRNDAPT